MRYPNEDEAREEPPQLVSYEIYFFLIPVTARFLPALIQFCTGFKGNIPDHDPAILVELTLQDTQASTPVLA